jgi:hypothetical protein
MGTEIVLFEAVKVMSNLFLDIRISRLHVELVPASMLFTQLQLIRERCSIVFCEFVKLIVIKIAKTEKIIWIFNLADEEFFI